MADLPSHIQGYAIIENATSDTPLSSLPPIPPSLPLPLTTRSHRRDPSPPAPTLYLTGFSCVASDPEYAYARKSTGDTQPYWFEEAYGAADFNEGVRRRARQDMAPLEVEVAIIDLDDAGNEMNKVTARDQRERARERLSFRQELEGAFEGDKVSIDSAADGLTDLSQNMNSVSREEDKQREKRMRREEEWKNLEVERKRLRKEREKLKAEEKEEKQKEKDGTYPRPRTSSAGLPEEE
jgi:hypothetical protein